MTARSVPGSASTRSRACVHSSGCAGAGPPWARHPAGRTWPGRSGTPSYLAVALSAGASAGGAWCAAVGLPALGVAAVAGLGADLRHLLLLDDPGERWAEAVAVLAGAVDLILVRPPGRVN